MIAAEDNRHFAVVEERERLFVNPVVDGIADFVDRRNFLAAELFCFGVPAHDFFRDRKHGDAGGVRTSGVAIEQIDLLRCFEHRGRSARCASTVRSRGFEGNGNDDDFRVVR